MSKTVTTRPLGQIARVINGRAYKQEELLNSGKHRVLRVGNFFSNGSWYYSDLELEQDKYCEQGDLLFAWSASFGPKIWDQEKVIYHYHIWKIVEDRKVLDRGYLYYYLLNSVKGMMASTHGSIMLHLTKDFMERLPVHFPSDLKSQARISSVLTLIDKKIECNNRINAELEAMAKTLYDYWFVQFDFPDANGKPYKSSGGKMVHNAILKREIPAGWEAATLSQFAELERGVTYGKEDVCTSDTQDSIGILRATNVTGNVVDVNDLVFVPSSKVSSAQTLKQYETLIVMSSGSKEHVGKNGIYYFVEPRGFGAFCSKITASTNHRFFVNTFLQSPWFKAHIKNSCLGTNINNLTNDHINDCLIAKPDVLTLQLFENKIGVYYEKISNNVRENQHLAQLRDWLLPLLMNSQVTVE